ncbi:predicted protein [Nematostella vectensis]|uniref:G-protein coupled receptors family 1 profile domain-containing protein n=1 Tax=Nematostella vectensis TaxID=45351 RepID=A7SIA3_NEMVE|nr:galanin receptor 2a [Nematostella vectensis]EDO36558.1 predicted protein [Nematostella vectensis]|eukprot:XP_001628621.1 predicted protein [Nematostella vectensis]
MNATNTTGGSVDITLRAMRLALYPTVLLLGIVGNILVCSVILHQRSRNGRPTTRYFVLNLAISDLLVLIMFIPFDLAYLEYEVWTFGLAMCKIINTISYAFVTISGTTLAAISMDRHRAIVYPMRQPFSARAVTLIIVFMWVYAVLTLVPFAGSLRIFPDGQCLNDPAWWGSTQAFQLTYLFCGFFPGAVIPVCCISVSYLSIAHHLYCEHRRQLHEGIIGSRTASQRMRQNLKTTRVLTALVAVYAVCVLPHYIILALVFFDRANTEKLAFIVVSHEFTRLLMTANSCLNPIMYSVVSKEFRQRLKALFASRKKAVSVNPVLHSPAVIRMELLSPALLMKQTRLRTSSFL